MERTIPRSIAAMGWLAQAISGVLLMGLLGLHMIANHFVVEGGLQTYADVVRYLSNPILLGLELIFLITVTFHALLGVRSILFDTGLSGQSQQRVSAVLTILGLGIIGYGFWLSFTIVL